MTQKEILQGNKLIAAFMGYVYQPVEKDGFKPGYWFEWEVFGGKIEGGGKQFICNTHEGLQFHSSWDYLMQAVEKICRIKIGDGTEYVEYCYPRTFGMVNQDDGNFMVRFNGQQLFQSNSLIEATYLSVIRFINWYNKNKED